MHADAAGDRPLPGLGRLLPLPPETVRQFDTARPELVARVDAALFRRPDLGVLLGDAPSSSVRELHRYLGAFLGSVFSLGVPEILQVGLPRLLAGYRSRGLTEDYFQVLPDLWCQAMEDQLGPRATPLTRICGWMREHPEAWLPEGGEPAGRGQPAPEVQRLVKVLLTGDAPAARSVIRMARKGGATVEEVFVEMVQPALYEIGTRWEQGRISAAQEHLASALVARILSSLDEELPSGGERVAVVTTAPTETHEFGAWMVSDVLRAAGWSVRFLGSQLPVEEILHYLRLARPEVLAVSVTLEIHLPSLRELVQALRADEELQDLPVLVGGQAFAAGDRVWRSAGADAMARDAREVVEAVTELAGAPAAGSPGH
ncbi:MAG TPA: cobalamin-dependent protein [Longimicrobiales bacterium]|nr:cobalamin-dependent protein [Longimicrobiales bacterium]